MSKLNDISMLRENNADPYLEKIGSIISGVDSLFDMRKPLQNAGFKVDYHNGDTGYVIMVTPKGGRGKTVAICSKNMVDDPDVVIGKYAIGYLGEGTNRKLSLQNAFINTSNGVSINEKRTPRPNEVDDYSDFAPRPNQLVVDFEGLKKRLTENLNRLNNVHHNKGLNDE